MKRPASIAFGSPPNACLSGKTPPLSKIAHNLIKNSKESSPLAVIDPLYNLTFKTFIVAMFSPPLEALNTLLFDRNDLNRPFSCGRSIMFN